MQEMRKMKRHHHDWSPLHKRCGINLMVRVCLVVGCEGITDGKKILFKDGRIVRLSAEMRRCMAARLTLQNSTEGRLP
jgi:hypothetical protein